MLPSWEERLTLGAGKVITNNTRKNGSWVGWRSPHGKVGPRRAKWTKIMMWNRTACCLNFRALLLLEFFCAKNWVWADGLGTWGKIAKYAGARSRKVWRGVPHQGIWVFLGNGENPLTVSKAKSDLIRPVCPQDRKVTGLQWVGWAGWRKTKSRVQSVGRVSNPRNQWSLPELRWR